MVSPLTEIGLELAVVVTKFPLDGLQVALKLLAMVSPLKVAKLITAEASPATTVVSVGVVGNELLTHPENGLDELEDALHAVTVTELVATLLLPSVMVMVAT